MSDFWPLQPTAGVVFYMRDLQSIGLRVAQKKNFEKIFSEIFKKLLSFPKIYFGHSPTTQSLRNPFFGKKSSQKSLSHVPPPFSYLRNMKTTLLVETSNEHNFLSNKAFLTILSALESSDNELSDNLKNFQFLVLFCIQNGI